MEKNLNGFGISSQDDELGNASVESLGSFGKGTLSDRRMYKTYEETYLR